MDNARVIWEIHKAAETGGCNNEISEPKSLPDWVVA